MAAGENLASIESAFQFIFRASIEQAVGTSELDCLAQCRKVVLARSEQRTHLVQVHQSVNQVLLLGKRGALRNIVLLQHNRLQYGNIGLNPTAKEAPIHLSGAHSQRQPGNLSGAGVNFHTMQVLGQNESRNIAHTVFAL